MDEFNIVHTLPESDWRRFIGRNPNSNIFHSPEMFRVYSKSSGHQINLWAAVNQQKQILAMFFPVDIFLNDGLLRYFTTRTVAYGSVLSEPSPEGDRALRYMLQSYIKDVNSASLFTELRNLSDLKSTQAVLNQGKFYYEDHMNFLIDLTGTPEAVFNNIGQRTRKNIRRALSRTELVVEEITERDQIRDWYGVLQLTYKAANVPLAHRSLFEIAFDILHPNGMIRFTQTRVGKSIAAISAELLYKDVIYGWYGGVNRTFSRFTPNELLMWRILEWGFQNGFKVYDFGGAGRPNEPYGVRDFKAKFGGRLVGFGRNTNVHRPLTFWLARRIYNLVRHWL